jgi:site-specific DNA-methyltransferase (cytosine-N4-specific)
MALKGGRRPSRSDDVSGSLTTPAQRTSFANGRLKDTPANRALSPDVMSVETFANESHSGRAFYSDDMSLVFMGDVKDVLRHLIDANVRVNCIVTSPPFYGQRDYDVEGQIGLELHPQDYIDGLVDVFELCRELLVENGSIWVNIGDTFWSGKGAHKSHEAKQTARRFGLRPQDRPGDGRWARPKQLLLIPHRFAIAMQDRGFLVRNDNVWVKPNPVPDQVRDRCSIAHEYVFHFTLNRWYFFDRARVARTSESGAMLPPLDTWAVPPARGSRNHRAAFSEELVRIPILSTTPPGGVVLDPFAGSGTSLLFARRHGFRSIGIDLKPEYCVDMAAALGGADSGGPVPSE